MEKKGIKRIACIICVFLMVSILSGCVSVNITRPMLKVITSEQVGVTIFNITRYYIVYENGTVKKTKEFEPADVTSYSSFSDSESSPFKFPTLLNNFDVTTAYGAELYEITSDILQLASEANFSAYRLFVFSNRYFFVADCGDEYVYLFEYIRADNTIQEVGRFKHGNITHVELYKP